MAIPRYPIQEEQFQDSHRQQNPGMLKSLTLNGIVCAYNLYFHISYSKVCLQITSFIWIQYSAWCVVNSSFLFGTLWKFFLIFSNGSWLNPLEANLPIRKANCVRVSFTSYSLPHLGLSAFLL